MVIVDETMVTTPSHVFKLTINMRSYSVSGSSADCKSVVFGLGWFDSITTHQLEKAHSLLRRGVFTIALLLKSILILYEF